MITKLEVFINGECKEALESYQAKHDVTITETIRRAISVLHYLDNSGEESLDFVEENDNER